jgi:hypothetical protein
LVVEDGVVDHHDARHKPLRIELAQIADRTLMGQVAIRGDPGAIVNHDAKLGRIGNPVSLQDDLALVAEQVLVPELLVESDLVREVVKGSCAKGRDIKLVLA